MEDNNLNRESQGNVNRGNQGNLNTENQGNFKKEGQGNLKARKIVYYILGVLEVLFAFRLIFKILGANPESTFVDIIYSVTGLFLAPFMGIFRTAVSKGIETQSVLEPMLIIAMAVYACIAWGIIKIIEISSNHKDTGTL